MLTCTFLGALPTEASTTTLGQGKARRSLFLLLMLPRFKVDLTSLSEMCLQRLPTHKPSMCGATAYSHAATTWCARPFSAAMLDCGGADVEGQTCSPCGTAHARCT